MNLIKFLLITSVIAQTKPRFEIRELSNNQIQQFNENFVTLYKNENFTNFVKTHSDFFPLIHNTPMFLPFHRLYIKYFEDHFMNNITFGIPYVNWALDAVNVSNSILFTGKYIGSNDDEGTIKNSVFRNITLAFPQNEILKRMVNITNGYTERIRNAIIRLSSTFSNLSKTMELGIHGLYHSRMTFTMNTVYSPNDPLFFLHHSFIDKIWYDWQLIHGNAFDTESYNKVPFNKMSLVPYFNITVLKSLDISYLNYTNNSYVNTSVNVIPDKPTNAFLRMNKFTIKEIKDNEIFNLQVSNSHRNIISILFVFLLIFI